jgi:hypothetical protein
MVNKTNQSVTILHEKMLNHCVAALHACSLKKTFADRAENGNKNAIPQILNFQYRQASLGLGSDRNQLFFKKN